MYVPAYKFNIVRYSVNELSNFLSKVHLALLFSRKTFFERFLFKFEAWNLIKWYILTSKYDFQVYICNVIQWIELNMITLLHSEIYNPKGK